MTAHFASNNLKLLSTASVLPGPPVSNEELIDALKRHAGARNARKAQLVTQKLQIRSRHLSRSLKTSLSGTRAPDDAPGLCSRAVTDALRSTDRTMAEIDYLLGHTITPHTLVPPNIAWVAQQLEFSGPFMEIRQACVGFASALQIAAGMIGSESAHTIAIVGSETGSPFFDISSKFLDTGQLVNYVQMGDGAAACILTADDHSNRHIISDMFSGHIGIDQSPGFSLKGGGSQNPSCAAGFPVFEHDAASVRSNGPELFHAGIHAVLERGFRLDEFNWIIPHQANGEIGSLFSKEFRVAEEKVFVTADTLGNLGSAAIWVSFDRLRRSGKLKQGHRVLILGAEASKYMYGGFVYQH